MYVYTVHEESVTVCEDKHTENSIEKEKEDDSRHLYCCVLYQKDVFLKSGSLCSELDDGKWNYPSSRFEYTQALLCLLYLHRP